jgi:hypothetical protein
LSIRGSLNSGEAASQELDRSFTRRMKDEPDYSSENKEYLHGVHDERKRLLVLDCNDAARFYSISCPAYAQLSRDRKQLDMKAD